MYVGTMNVRRTDKAPMRRQNGGDYRFHILGGLFVRKCGDLNANVRSLYALLGAAADRATGVLKNLRYAGGVALNLSFCTVMQNRTKLSRFHTQNKLKRKCLSVEEYVR